MIVCHLAGGDEIVISIKNMKFYTLTAVPSEKRVLSYSSQRGDEDECTLGLCCKFEINCLLSAWLAAMKLSGRYKYNIYVWAAVPSEKRIASYYSQYSDAIRCSLSPCCKFGLNLRLFAIWLVTVMIKFLRRSKYEIFVPGLPCHLSKE